MGRPVYANAVYKGDDSRTDLYTGHSYTIEIVQGFFGRLFVYPVHGHEYKRYAGIRPIISRDLKQFIADWQIKGFLGGPKWRYLGDER